MPKGVYKRTEEHKQKMSKSLGNFIDLETIQMHCDNVGKDAYRYYMAKEGPLFSDSDFSKERFYQTYNTDLANNFGNLVNRIFKLVQKNFKRKPRYYNFQNNCLETKPTNKDLIKIINLWILK